MKRILILILTINYIFLMQAKTSSQEVAKQLISNLHGGVDVHTLDGETSLSGYVGTGYYFYFDDKNRLYLYPQFDISWGESKAESNYSMKTTSILIPVTLGYNAIKSDLVTLGVFGGVKYEQILNVTNNTYTSDVNRSQVGLTGGATIRLIDKISLNLSYYYGLTTYFADGTGRMTSFNFSFNF